MFREIILPIFRSTRLCVTACGVMHRRCCRPKAEGINSPTEFTKLKFEPYCTNRLLNLLFCSSKHVTMEELHCCVLSLLEAVGFRCIAASDGRQRDALRGFHNVGYSAHFEQRLLKTLIPRPPRGYCQPVCCSHGQFREAIVFYLASDRCNITTTLRSNKITCE